MPITFEVRPINGQPMSVALYDDNLYRVDDEGNNRIYVSATTDAPYKYFTTTADEAVRGYGGRYQMLRTWHPSRQLILLNLFDSNTRLAVYNLLSDSEKANMDYSFPVENGVVGRKSEGEHVRRNYNVMNAICTLFSAHGVDGYYIPTSRGLHSEVALCQATLQQPNILREVVRAQRVAPPKVPKIKEINPRTQSSILPMKRLIMDDDDDDEETNPPEIKRIRRNTRRRKRKTRRTRRAY